MLTIRIKTDNDAFAESAPLECARILREIADKLEEGSDGGPIMDANGNKVGSFTLTD